MFSTATKNFVDEVDGDGVLIPVCSLNDSVGLLSLVVKCERFWAWQKPKYLPTTFNLNDVLTGQTPLTPVVTKADFIGYKGTFGVNVEGNAEANLVRANMNVGGKCKDTSKLQSSFGILKKEEVDLQTLLLDCKDRLLDMSHVLVQQTREKKRQVFGVVKERIVTTQRSSVTVTEEAKQGCQCILSFCLPKIPKVSLKEDSHLSHNSNVTMEIPPFTAIAYGLIELEVKVDGQYELCLLSNTNGSFEVDGPAQRELFSVASMPKSIYKNVTQELDTLSGHYQLLSSLAAPTATSLFGQLMKATEDREALSLLQSAMRLKCFGECPVLGDVLNESQHQIIQDILEQSGGPAQSPDSSTSILSALYLVVSALDEIPDECIAILGTFSPQGVNGLEQLVQCIISGRMEACLAPLTGETYEKAQYLFASCGVTLKADVDTVKVEINKEPQHCLLVLSIAIRGLASLAARALGVMMSVVPY